MPSDRPRPLHRRASPLEALDRLPRIFDRFYRAGAQPGRPGAGLGLAIVAEIALAHDGSAEATLKSPHGLRVTLILPVPS